jgi:hypothetical protein
MFITTCELDVRLPGNTFDILLDKNFTPVTLALVKNISLPTVMFPVDDILVNAPLAGVILPMIVLFKLLIVIELSVADPFTVKFATVTLPVALRVDTIAAFPPRAPNLPWNELLAVKTLPK